MERCERSAEQGYAIAQYNLGGMHATGRGVPLDDVRAYTWLALAAERSAKSSVRDKAMSLRDSVGSSARPRPFDGLRHNFASTLASEGTNLYTIQKLLPQETPQMTKRYAHLRDEALRKAADTAGRVLSGSENEKYGNLHIRR